MGQEQPLKKERLVNWRYVKWSTKNSKHIKTKEQDPVKWSNLHLIDILENMGSERISEQKMAENFLKLMNFTNPQI